MFASIVSMLALVVVVWPVATAAFRSARGIGLPYPLAIVLRNLPILFPIHMVASACALLLVPLAIASWRVPRLHRWIGRSAAALILIGGAASLFVAAGSVATTAARAGFFCQGLVWLGLCASGVSAIRRKQRARHAMLMRAAAIVTISPVLLRLLLHFSLVWRFPFNRTYALLAWGVWLVPLAIYALYQAVRLVRTGQLEGARHAGAPTYLKSTVIG